MPVKSKPMMSRRENWHLAVDALRSHKLRSILTLLGVIIGVATVIAVVSVIQGLNDYVASRVMDFGSTSFTVSKFSQGFNTLDDFWRESKRRNLTTEDMDAITEGCQHCQMTAGVYGQNKKIRYKNKSIENCNLRGVTANAAFVGQAMELSFGRHFTPADIDHARPGVIIGADVADRFFPYEDPLGKEMWIDGQVFNVIGVATKTGEFFGQSQDTFVRIPITVFKKMYGTSSMSLNILVQARTPQDMKLAIDESRIILRNRMHRGYKDDDGFSIATADTFLDLWAQTTGSIFFVTIIIASVALVVGGVVIMNIMLVSVTERTREIGLRKALGARRTDILQQFLFESVLLAAIGGLLGVTSGLGVAWLVSMFTPLPMSIKYWAVSMGLIVATSIGVFFGIYPARTAALLDPVEALRAE